MRVGPIAVLNEHPEWQRRLYDELRRRDLPFEEIALHAASFDPTVRTRRYSLVVNRASPSAATRDHGGAIFFAGQMLGYFEQIGVRVINGRAAYEFETSKALQTLLLERLGVKYPRTRIANSPSSVRDAAEGLVYPLLIKPNIGGSGAGIRRFDEPASLHAWLDASPAFGIDGTVLVQEFHPSRDGYIVRVEMLGERHLYSVRIYPDSADFNLCPADICQVGAAPAAPAAPASDFENCAVAVVAKGLRIERHDEAPEVIATARRIVAAAHLDVGGIEYLVSARDGERYFYDINALSNFVRDAPTVVGFDPTADFVDYLEKELRLHSAGVSV